MSDLHFAVESDYGNNYTENRYIELLLDWKNRYRPSTFSARIATNLPKVLADHSFAVDALLITGDLATTGTQNDLDSAKDWIAGNAAARHIPRNLFRSDVAPRLATVAKTLIIMPGNHDRFQRQNNIPRSPLFETVFGSHWDMGSGRTMPAENVPEIRKTIIQNGDDWLIVLCADFSLREKSDQDCIFGYLGQGRAYQNICDELVLETQFCREQHPNALIVWASHFPPKFDHERVGPRLRLLDEDKLLTAAADAEVRVIFSGHTHISKAYTVLGSRVVVVCAGTPIAFGKDEEQSFNTVTLSANQGSLTNLNVVRCSWHDKRATFKPSGSSSSFLFNQ